MIILSKKELEQMDKEGLLIYIDELMKLMGDLKWDNDRLKERCEHYFEQLNVWNEKFDSILELVTRQESLRNPTINL